MRDEWKLGLLQVKQLCSTAMYTVMRQEIDRFNNLLIIIHKSLNALILAVKVHRMYMYGCVTSTYAAGTGA